MSIAAAIASIIYIIVSIKNFKSFLINVSSNPLNIIHKYEECTEGKIIKRIILIIIGTLILGRYMAINILPFIFTMINRHYVLDNAQIFNKVKKNLLKNQNTVKI